MQTQTSLWPASTACREGWLWRGSHLWNQCNKKTHQLETCRSLEDEIQASRMPNVGHEQGQHVPTALGRPINMGYSFLQGLKTKVPCIC